MDHISSLARDHFKVNQDCCCFGKRTSYFLILVNFAKFDLISSHFVKMVEANYISYIIAKDN